MCRRRRVRCAAGVTTPTVSGMLLTLGDGSVSKGTAVGSCSGAAIVVVGARTSGGGRLRPLRRNDSGGCAVGVTFAIGLCFLSVRGACTLGDGCTNGDGEGAVELWEQNISASWRRAASWASLMGANGVFGCGCCSAAVRSRAASMAASADDVAGMSYRYGKNSTVLAIRLARVFVMYTLWQR